MLRVLLLVLSTMALPSCSFEGSDNNPPPRTVKFATFNVSFAHDGDPTESFAPWIKYMNMPFSQQESLIQEWKSGSQGGAERKLAERVMQIRNVAAIIQVVRPDVLLLNEFNNDGYGKNDQALQGFQKNYLAIAQSMNSVDGGDLLDPIIYPYMQNYATNTGLPSGMDLANNGYDQKDPNDAYGFGFYHGHYAFALLSRYKIDAENTRTFQTFKRKDLPNAVMPTINVCTDEKPLPKAMTCGDNWFNDEEWQQLRLSSKNHVDAPIIIPGSPGASPIHVLLAHPTPAAFDTFSDNNKYRNSDENAFWLHYINGHKGIYDDKGVYGGFSGESFVIMGDLNADTVWGTTTDARFNGIQHLMSHPRVNQSVVRIDGKYSPTSSGAAIEPNRRNHPHPNIRTATFGSRADYSVPSADLKVIESGVYWQAEGEPGRLLFNDSRIGSRGTDKQVSSDHRLVWVTIEL
ncbi:endonuclease/exonuclease/phosphatase family protein [Aliiglaciecola sp.]|nr:endonuclease/exonuclease/phosphatase family protein [Aliiglaciecola sp.]